MTTRTLISRSLIGLAIGFGFMWAGSALADTPVPPPPGVIIDVTGVAEPSSPDPENNCTGTDPVTCPSLREAIMFANGNTATDGTQTQDTIVLPEGTYVLTIEGADERFDPVGSPDEAPPVTNAPDAGVGDLDLTESVIIEGAGSALTVIQWDEEATVKDRIFHVYDPTEDIFAEIRGLTVRNGELLAESLGEGPPSDLGNLPTEWRGMRAGAGIAMGPAATAVLNDPNKEGGPDSSQGGEGGSQKPDDPGDETGGSYALTLSDVQISDNATDGDGGGLYNAGPVTANEIVVTRNTSGKNGGGIYNEGESLIERSTIANNAAEGGGGMFVTGNPATSLRVNSTTFSGNTAVGGGAISGRVVMIYLTNCTVSGNTGLDVGGGVYANGVVELLNCSVVDNEATGAEAFGGAGVNVFKSGKASLTLSNTLLAGNVAGAEGGGREANCGCTGSQTNCISGTRLIETDGYNLSDDLSCNLDNTGDQDNVPDAVIGLLADNGGPTLTYALLDGSPAIDKGPPDDDACPNNDQRGSLRPADGDEDGTKVCDIGAFELSPDYTDLHIKNLTAPDEVVRLDAVPIVVEADAGLDPVNDVVLTTTISDQLTFVLASYSINEGDPVSCTQDAGTVTCSIGTMAAGDLATVNIATTASSVGTATIETMVVSSDDTDETNNSASVTVAIRGIADMQLEASPDEAVTVGDEVTVTASVTNNGPDEATSVQVFSEVPSGTTFVSATSDAGSCTEADGQVVCELADMVAAGPSAEVALVLTADEIGSIDATLTVGVYESDPDVANDTDSITITVNETGTGGTGGDGGTGGTGGDGGTDDGCSCTVDASDGGGSILLSLGVLAILLWRRRSSNMS